jgi:hypothetical protein
VRGCRVKAEVAERENELFPERRRALLNHARTRALRAMNRAGYEVSASACILVQTVEPQSRGLDHGHLVLGHASKVEKAFARFFVDALARFSGEHGLGFVDRYNHALWRQRQYQGGGQAERAARYLSKYVSKERASEWLREKVGQRVFYVAPWLSRTAGASMRIARLERRMWASDHGYCERPRCTEEELEAAMKFLAARDGPPVRVRARRPCARPGRVKPAARPMCSVSMRQSGWSCSMAHPSVPSTRTQKRGGGTTCD